MMLNLKEAREILSKNIPGCKIKKYVVYNGKFVFYAPFADLIEGDMDAYWYVDIRNGKFGGFPISLPQNIACVDTFVKEGVELG